MAVPSTTLLRNERLLNLFIYLFNSTRGVTRAEIQEGIAAYRQQPSQNAFERMFERDKEALRDIGIPIESFTGAHGQDSTYAIDRQRYELPAIDLTPEERGALIVAARVWDDAAIGSQATAALIKLGIARELESAPPLAVSLGDEDPTFRAVLQAVRERVPLRFTYRKPGQQHADPRRVEPYVITSYLGTWYLIGNDLDHEDTRVFRLSRIEGAVERVGESGSYVLPTELTHERLISLLTPRRGTIEARVRVRAGAGQSLRAIAHSVSAHDDHWEIVELSEQDPQRLLTEVLGLGSAAVIEAPEDLRAAAVHALRELSGGQGQ